MGAFLFRLAQIQLWLKNGLEQWIQLNKAELKPEWKQDLFIYLIHSLFSLGELVGNDAEFPTQPPFSHSLALNSILEMQLKLNRFWLMEAGQKQDY